MTTTTPTNKAGRAAGWIGAVAIALVVLLVAVIAIVHFVPMIFGSSAKATIERTDEDREAIIDALTIKSTSADAECNTDNYGLVKFQIGALEPVPDPRKWSDALGTPIASSDPEEARDELQQTICEDPLLGASYLTFFATDVRNLLIENTGVDIVELNEWLKPYAADPNEINVTAAGFIPLLDVKDPSEAQIDAAMDLNRDWQHEAEFVNTLLDRFEVSEIDARKSIVNYHLAIGGLVVGNLPAVERNDKQENLPALIFSLTEKDQCRELLSIGANVGDKRPELFEAKECEPTPTPTPTSTTPSEEPECTEDCDDDGKTGRWKGGDGINVDPGEYTGETAPDVVTEEESSEGIVDNANQTPGSETGGQSGGGATSHGDEGRGDTGEVQDDLNGDDDDGSSETVVTNPFG